MAGHKNKALDDDAKRTIRETREYLTTAAELLTEQTAALDFFNAMLERFPNG